MTPCEKASRSSLAERLKVDLITDNGPYAKPLFPWWDIPICWFGVREEAFCSCLSRKFEQRDSARLKSPPAETVQDRLDINVLAEQTMGNMEDVIADSGFVIRTEFGEEPLPFLGDNGKMHRVVQNLLENALKILAAGNQDLSGGFWRKRAEEDVDQKISPPMRW